MQTATVGFPVLEAPQQGRAVVGLLEQVQQPIDRQIGLGDLRGQGVAVGAGIGGSVSHRIEHFFGETRRQVRMDQPGAEPRQNTGFHLVPHDRLGVRTNGHALGLAIVAAVAILGDERIATATASTGQEPGQQVSGPVAVVERCGLASVAGVGLLEAILDRVPEIVADDLKRRCGGVDDLGDIFGLRDSKPGLRVALERVAVVDDHPDVGLVAQHPVALLGVAAYGAVVPACTGRGGDTFRVQIRCDLAGRQSRSVVPKDAPHDRGLVRIDLAVQSARAGHDPVAVSETGRDPGPLCRADLAALGLFGDLPGLELCDGPVEGDQLPVQLATAGGDELDVACLEPVGEPSYVGSATPDTIDAFHDQAGDVTLRDAILHRHDAEPRAHQGPARDRIVRKLASNGEAEPLRRLARQCQLVFAGHVVLLVRAVAGVEDRFE